MKTHFNFRSEKKGYHVNRNSQEVLFNWRKELEPNVNQLATYIAERPNEGETAQEFFDKRKDRLSSLKEEIAQKYSKELNRCKTTKLFVGRLSKRVTDEILFEAFRQFGAIKSSKVQLDEKGVSRGFGFVEFAGIFCCVIHIHW